MGPTYLWSLGPLQIRINWLILACVLLTIFGFVQLGLWQWGRAGEKLAAQEEFEQQQLLTAQPIESIEAELRLDNTLWCSDCGEVREELVEVLVLPVVLLKRQKDTLRVLFGPEGKP